MCLASKSCPASRLKEPSSWDSLDMLLDHKPVECPSKFDGSNSPLNKTARQRSKVEKHIGKNTLKNTKFQDVIIFF